MTASLTPAARAAGWRFLALSTLMGLAGARLAIGAPPPRPREISVSDDRANQIRGKIAAALRRALGKKIASVDLDLPIPRLERSGEGVDVIFDRGEIHLAGLDVSGIKVRGTIRFEDLRLDYGALGLRRFRLTGTPRVFPNLETSLENVDAYLAAHGFRDTFVEQAGDGIVFGGRRPVRILMVRSNPLVTVKGRFHLDGTTLGFAVSDVKVRDTTGPVAAAIQRRIFGESQQTIDLKSLFEGFEIDAIAVHDGQLRVMSGAVELLAQRLGDAPPPHAAG